MRDCSCHGLDYPDKTRKISNLTNSNLISIVEIPYHADVPTVLCKSCMRKTKEDIAKCSFTTFDIFTVDYVSIIILSQYSNQVSVLHCFGIFPFSYSIKLYYSISEEKIRENVDEYNITFQCTFQYIIW
jgi:hypothetical protein